MKKIEKFFEHKLHKNTYQLLDYLDKLSSDKVFVFVDTETTGLGGHKKQQLTQISAIAYEYNFQQNALKEIGTFNKKIKISTDIKYKLEDPNDRIYKVFKFNHYGDKIKDDPKYYDEQQILSEFRNWVAHTGYYLEPLLIMQNSIFDMNMLVGRGEKLPYEVLDTKQLLQLFVIPIIRKLSETDNKYQDILDEIGTSERDFGMTTSAMGKWGPFFGINMSGYHDALTDCKITAQMFTKMIDFIKDNSDLDISKYQSERIFVNKF